MNPESILWSIILVLAGCVFLLVWMLLIVTNNLHESEKTNSKLTKQNNEPN
jgi:hypothetical protein